MICSQGCKKVSEILKRYTNIALLDLHLLFLTVFKSVIAVIKYFILKQ